jgi:myo-inositol-1(or 4)-monophosphatase
MGKAGIVTAVLAKKTQTIRVAFMADSYQKMLEVALQAANKAAKLIIDARRDSSIQTSVKIANDHVTNVDIACEEAIKETILKAFPDHRFLAEETASSETDFSGPLWIIDPIDGTTNYVRGHFQVAVAIAFALDGVVQAGVVHTPFHGETFSALKGSGAKLNDSLIHCSKCTDFSDALIATGFPPRTKRTMLSKQRFCAVIDQARDIRRAGAAAPDICWVACGRLDGYYESVSPWDMAAAGLIAREAGAITANLSANPNYSNIPSDINGHDFVVAAPGIFEKLGAVLAGKSS